MSPLIAISLHITLLMRRKTMNCDKENKNICGLSKHCLRNLWHITVVLVHDMPAFHSPWHMQKNPSAAIQSLDVSTINNQRYQTHWEKNLGLRWLLVHIKTVERKCKIVRAKVRNPGNMNCPLHWWPPLSHFMCELLHTGQRLWFYYIMPDFRAYYQCGDTSNLKEKDFVCT